MFQIGFPLDAGENSHYVAVNLIRAFYHSCKGCGTSLGLVKDSGAEFVWSRVCELHKYYRFQFSIFPEDKRSPDKKPDTFFTQGNSDFGACALAVAQNADTKRLRDLPLVLISCSFRPNPIEQGLHEVEMDAVTTGKQETASKSLLNKWKAACNAKACALVLHETDVQILSNVFQGQSLLADFVPADKVPDILPLVKANFQSLTSRKNENPAIISCQSHDLPVLARALGIESRILESRTQSKIHRYIAFVSILGILALVLTFFLYFKTSVSPATTTTPATTMRFYQADGLAPLPSDNIVYSNMGYKIKLTIQEKGTFAYIYQSSETGFQQIFPTPDAEIRNHPDPEIRKYWYEFPNPSPSDTNEYWIPPKSSFYFDKIKGHEKFLLIYSPGELSNEELKDIHKRYAISTLGYTFKPEKNYSVILHCFKHE